MVSTDVGSQCPDLSLPMDTMVNTNRFFHCPDPSLPIDAMVSTDGAVIVLTLVFP